MLLLLIMHILLFSYFRAFSSFFVLKHKGKSPSICPSLHPPPPLLCIFCCCSVLWVVPSRLLLGSSLLLFSFFFVCCRFVDLQASWYVSTNVLEALSSSTFAAAAHFSWLFIVCCFLFLTTYSPIPFSTFYLLFLTAHNRRDEFCVSHSCMSSRQLPQYCGVGCTSASHLHMF